MDFLANLDWTKIFISTGIAGIGFFIYLYGTRGKELWRELCFDTHTYGADDICMVCGAKNPVSNNVCQECGNLKEGFE